VDTKCHFWFYTCGPKFLLVVHWKRRISIQCECSRNGTFYCGLVNLEDNAITDTGSQIIYNECVLVRRIEMEIKGWNNEFAFIWNVPFGINKTLMDVMKWRQTFCWKSLKGFVTGIVNSNVLGRWVENSHKSKLKLWFTIGLYKPKAVTYILLQQWCHCWLGHLE